MRLAAYLSDTGPAVAVTTAAGCHRVRTEEDIRAIAESAWHGRRGLAEEVVSRGVAEAVDLAELALAGRLLTPVTHPDSAHCFATGTGLTHLGAAAARDAMHKTLAAGGASAETDTMRMFSLGLAGGKPAKGESGVQPEWFWKGDGRSIVPPGQPIASPPWAEDAGEEPEIAGVYLIAPDGTPLRLGFVQANEFSDHVMERRNYLYLAHSKLRQMSFGPELLLGDLPGSLTGQSRLHRDGAVYWQNEFLTGEENMCHSIDNLERHHFKYRQFLRPGDVQYHMFGTATISFADGVKTRPGDVMELSIPEFGLPLKNPLTTSTETLRSVTVL